jgi:hypothetical protein
MIRDEYGRFWFDNHEENLMQEADESALHFIQTIEKESGMTVAQVMDKDECASITTMLTDDILDEQDAETGEFVSRVVLEIGRTMDQIVIEFLVTTKENVPLVTCDILGLKRSWQAYDGVKAMIIEDMKALKDK